MNKRLNKILAVGIGWLCMVRGAGAYADEGATPTGRVASPARTAGSYRAVSVSSSMQISLGCIIETRWFDGDRFRMDREIITNQKNGDPKRTHDTVWKLSDGWWLWDAGRDELQEPPEKMTAALALPRESLTDPYGHVPQRTPPTSLSQETVEGVACDVWTYEIASPDGRTTGRVTEWRDPSIHGWDAADGQRRGLVKRYRLEMGGGMMVQTVTHDRFNFASLPAVSLLTLPAQVKRTSSVRVGTSAPQLTLADTHGLATRLGGAGAVRVVNFFATWCGPCKHELPDFVDVEQAFRNRGVAFLGVDVWEHRPGGSEDPEVLREFLKTHGVIWPVLLGTGTDVDTLYGLKGVPTTLVLDRQGRVVWKRVGGATAQALTDALETVLK